MNSSPHAPAIWRQRAVLGSLSVVIVVATVLRLCAGSLEPTPAGDDMSPVAAAIGLTRELPSQATLATYLYSLFYAFDYQITAATSSLPLIAWCARFLQDPVAFSLIARILVVEVSVLSVYLIYLLLARLVDPRAGVAAALLFALHPTAIALSKSLNSAPFCLLFFLLGLVLLTPSRRSIRTIELLAGALVMGFATETLPVAWLVALLLMAWHLRRAAPERRPRILAAVIVANLALALAALTVMAGWHAAEADKLLTMVVHGALVLAPAAALILLLRHLQQKLTSEVYSSFILGSALVLAALLLLHSSRPFTEAMPPPVDAASTWVMQSLPPETTIAVAASLRDRFHIPRTAQSWRWEFETPAAYRHYSRAWAAAGMYAASVMPRPAWNIIYIDDTSPFHDITGRPRRPDYLILPDTTLPSDTTDLWIVARFRSSTSDKEGVTIWGVKSTASSPLPVQVQWHIRQARRMASLTGTRG